MMVEGPTNFQELKEQEKEARKKILLNCAMTLFSKKPFFEVGLKEVAEAAGISTATIYRYFPSQEDLFYEAFFLKIADCRQDFENIVKVNESDTFEQITIKLVRYLFDNHFIVQIVAYLMIKDNIGNPVFTKFNTIIKQYYNHFAQLFEKHGMSKMKAKQYSHSFVGSMTGIFMGFRSHPFKSKEEIQKYTEKIIRLTTILYSDKIKKY